MIFLGLGKKSVFQGCGGGGRGVSLEVSKILGDSLKIFDFYMILDFLYFLVLVLV